MNFEKKSFKEEPAVLYSLDGDGVPFWTVAGLGKNKNYENELLAWKEVARRLTMRLRELEHARE